MLRGNVVHVTYICNVQTSLRVSEESFSQSRREQSEKVATLTVACPEFGFIHLLLPISSEARVSSLPSSPTHSPTIRGGRARFSTSPTGRWHGTNADRTLRRLTLDLREHELRPNAGTAHTRSHSATGVHCQKLPGQCHLTHSALKRSTCTHLNGSVLIHL